MQRTAPACPVTVAAAELECALGSQIFKVLSPDPVTSRPSGSCTRLVRKLSWPASRPRQGEVWQGKQGRAGQGGILTGERSDAPGVSLCGMQGGITVSQQGGGHSQTFAGTGDA